MEQTWIEKLAIQELCARYAHAIDNLEPEAWVQCFTPDGGFQVATWVVRGHAALREYADVHVREIRCRHMTSNLLYEVDGNEATGQVSVLAALATPGGYKIFGQGRYVDRLVKQGGQWRIAHRHVDVDPLATDPDRIIMCADPEVAALTQPLIDTAQRLAEQVEG